MNTSLLLLFFIFLFFFKENQPKEVEHQKKKKGQYNRQRDKKKKKERKKKSKEMKTYVHLHTSIFFLLYTHSFPLSFLSILGRRHFSGFWRKHTNPHHFFFFFFPPSLPIKHPLKIFSPLFTHQFFIFSKIPPTLSWQDFQLQLEFLMP